MQKVFDLAVAERQASSHRWRSPPPRSGSHGSRRSSKSLATRALLRRWRVARCSLPISTESTPCARARVGRSATSASGLICQWLAAKSFNRRWVLAADPQSNCV